MGSLGVQEMIVIFLVALVLFGPKKLPELGRTIGKALTEFRRASNDLKATFEREMQTLERESNELKDSTRQIAGEIASTANLDFLDPMPMVESEPSNISNGNVSMNPEDHLPPAHDPSTVGASATPGAESNGTNASVSGAHVSGTPAASEPQLAAQATLATPAPDGTVPHTPAAHTEAEVSQHS
jgi:sec-independent protein translocase protein TatA